MKWFPSNTPESLHDRAQKYRQMVNQFNGQPPLHAAESFFMSLRHPLEMASLHQSVSLSASVDDRSSTYEDQDNGMDEADDTLAQCSDSPVIRLSFHPSFFICVLELSQKISFQRKCASLVPLLLMSAEAKRRRAANDDANPWLASLQLRGHYLGGPPADDTIADLLARDRSN